MQDQLFEDHGRPRYRGKRRSTEIDRARWRAKTNRRHPSICRSCGTSFIGYYGKPYCSDACKTDAAERKPQQCRVCWSNCEHCGRTFIGRRPAQICLECRRTVYLERARAYNKTRPKQRKTRRVWIAGSCLECEQNFITEHHHASYCSAQCRTRAGRRLDKYRRSKRIKSGERQAIGLTSLAKRDGWMCHICHRRVSRKTWSMDHLIPLSEGGSHTWANVALAHFLCNSLRGARGAAQLRIE